MAKRRMVRLTDRLTAFVKYYDEMRCVGPTRAMEEVWLLKACPGELGAAEHQVQEAYKYAWRMVFVVEEEEDDDGARCAA